MYDYIDLILCNRTRKSNFIHLVISQLEKRNRHDLVLKIASWYKSQLDASKIEFDHYSSSILFSLSHAYLVKGELGKRIELEKYIKSKPKNEFTYINDLVTEQTLVHAEFCLGNWQKVEVKLRDIYKRLEYVYNNPENFRLNGEREKDEDMIRSIKRIASLSMQETLQNASFIYDVLGKTDTAILYLQKAIKLSEEIYGKRNINTCCFTQDYADLLVKSGQFEKASKLTTEVLAIRKKLLPSYSLSLANSHMSMGRVCIALYDYDLAREHLGKAHKVFSSSEKRGGLINMPLLHEEIAKLAYATADYETCLEVITKTISEYNRYFTVDHPVAVEAYKLKIACLKALGNDKEAEAVNSRYVNILKRYRIKVDREIVGLPCAA